MPEYIFFTHDNTEGYTDEQLEQANQMMNELDLDSMDKSEEDYYKHKILMSVEE